MCQLSGCRGGNLECAAGCRHVKEKYASPSCLAILRNSCHIFLETDYLSPKTARNREINIPNSGQTEFSAAMFIEQVIEIDKTSLGHEVTFF